VSKKKFDFAMNVGKVLIKNTFGSFKNHWRIFEGMPCRVNKAFMYVMACCVWPHCYIKQLSPPKLQSHRCSWITFQLKEKGFL
jgi:hypothetical protein